MDPTGLLRKPKDSHTVSIAFFSTPGTEWLYSGVRTMKASDSFTLLFHALTIGSEYVGSLMSPMVPQCSSKCGSGQSRRSATSTSKSPCASAALTTHGRTASAARPGRVLPTMIRSFDMTPCLAQTIGDTQTIDGTGKLVT